MTQCRAFLISKRHLTPPTPRAQGEASRGIRDTVGAPVADTDLSPRRSLLRSCMLGGFAGAALCLALQATLPLEGRGTAPFWFNWFSAGVFGIGLVWFFVQGKKDERWLSGSCLFALLALLGQTSPWSVSGGAEFASRTAQLLSTTHGGVALVALVYTWLALGVGLLCGRATLYCFTKVGPWERAASFLLSLLVAGFGAHAVIGYASGNSSLLLP